MAGIVSGSIAQDFSCYEIIESNTGLTKLYRPSLEQKACEVETFLVDNGFSNFRVIGRDFYPPLSFANEAHKSVFKALFERTVEEIESSTNNPAAYILITKEYKNEFGGLFYRIALKLPDSSPFNQLSILERAAIEGLVLSAINAKAGGALLNSRAEVAGLNELLLIFEKIIDGTFSVDTEQSLKEAGFTNVDLGTTPFDLTSDTCDAPVLLDNIFDYACLKIAGTETYLRTNADAAHGQIYFPAPAVIMTANTMKYYEERLKAAETQFNQLNQLFIFWMHFTVSDDEISVHYKTRANISETDAQAIMDLQYGSRMNTYWSLLDDGTNPALRGTENTGKARSSTENSYDCNQTACDAGALLGNLDNIKRWRAFCCLMPDATNFSPEALKQGVTCGLIDGLFETFLFVYEAGAGLKTTIEHTPFSIPWFVVAYERIRNEGSFWEGLKQKLNEDVTFWATVRDFVVNLPSMIGSIQQVVTDAIRLFFSNLDPRTGLGTTGYAIGKVAFEVIFNYLTGGTSTLTKISAFTNEGFTVLKNIAKSRGLTAGNLAHAWDKSKAVATKARCRLLYGGCFLAGTPVLAAGMQHLPIETITLGTPVYTHSTINQRQALTAATSPFLDSDPFTSEEQKAVDAIGLEEEPWFQIKLEHKQLDGSISKVQLLRPQSWLKSHKVTKVADNIWLSMPEQGLVGYATVTSLAHFRLTKILEDENPEADYELQPVTGIFEHTSNDVWTLVFDNGDTLGVTGAHPIYSVDYEGWRLAGELSVGEQILTKGGSAKLRVKKKKEGAFRVFNLEVREWHNFLVGSKSIVVHNSYFDIKFIDYIVDIGKEINLNPHRRKKVWRVLNKNQSPSRPIVPKNLTGLTMSGTPFTVEGHVATGSRTNTPYISAFTDRNKAIDRGISDGNEVVEIDLKTVGGWYIDLSNEAVRENLIKNPRTRSFAESSSEFLIIIEEIPVEAMTKIH